MLARVLILWLVLSNLAVALWWWAQPAPAADSAAAAVAAAETGLAATVPGLTLVRDLPPPANRPPCPEPGMDSEADATGATQDAGVPPQVDCVPLR